MTERTKTISLRLAASLVALVIAAPMAVHAAPAYIESFEVAANDWYDYADGAVVLDHALAPAGSAYAPDIAAATGLGFARMGFVDGCSTDCYGPYTNWGERDEAFPADGYSTSIRFYLDMDHAAANADHRVDFSSAINRANGDHLRDFIFNFGTDRAGDGTWVVSASNNAPGWPENPDRNPVVVTESGWYTFRHVFTEDAGYLHVVMALQDAAGETLGTWTFTGVDAIEDVGGNRYGWLVLSDVDGLAFDDAIKLVCTPVGPVAGLGC